MEMKPPRRFLVCFLMIVFFFMALAPVVQAQDSGPGKSQWVFPDRKGKLSYKTLEAGDKIADFSHAGYQGGGVSVPSVPVKMKVSPSGGDDSGTIQQAIDAVSKMELVNGFRGAVLLAPGTYLCEKALTLTASGVVLRGSGSGSNGTIITMKGDPHTCIIVKGSPESKVVGNSTTISDAYVPSGAAAFQVADASGFKTGDTIRITRPVTESWVSFMGMDRLVRDGKPQTWIRGDIQTQCIVKKITRNEITLEVPLTDSYDARYLGASGVTVEKISVKGELSQIGVEDIRIVSPGQSVTINQRHNKALTMGGIADGWVRNLEIFNTVNSISITARRVTVDNVSIMHDAPTIGTAKPADINGSGPQLLFNRCSITGDNVFFFATGPKVSGPIVLLNCTFKGNGWIQPHQRWATGVLVDGCEVPGGGIDFMNRGAMGSGHGWSIGWAVAWNCKAKSFLNQQPPGAANWVIGCRGERQQRAIPFDKQPFLPEGIYESHGTPVEPASLYLAQLSERLGEHVLKNIGY